MRLLRVTGVAWLLCAAFMTTLIYMRNSSNFYSNVQGLYADVLITGLAGLGVLSLGLSRRNLQPRRVNIVAAVITLVAILALAAFLIAAWSASLIGGM